MPRIFTGHAAVTHNLELKRFAPGDEVPEWLTVGDHLAKEADATDDIEDDTDEGDEDEDVLGTPEETKTVEEVVAEEQGPAQPEGTPDFTKPATPNRGGRPRKNS